MEWHSTCRNVFADKFVKFLRLQIVRSKQWLRRIRWCYVDWIYISRTCKSVKKSHFTEPDRWKEEIWIQRNNLNSFTLIKTYLHYSWSLSIFCVTTFNSKFYILANLRMHPSLIWQSWPSSASCTDALMSCKRTRYIKIYKE